ncbi:helix-turn-helix transcriptional regulator [Cellulophaga baltica]|uniref:winged helix-turn-helix transcriptional regulator n=1 Tax=Cellulophaga TaxID=104264 RepID=UPI001C079568|nr:MULTISPECIES: helix-turn-helix domain-containing protein [Cellulophaga]MBU2996331.1 helix-turn-helix transcriptional regulator [Cellulophaga baltica]MDO6767726.1 helix-turn-helix domain-containing protein [Cellulophaga sp. 1_MG-2023]
MYTYNGKEYPCCASLTMGLIGGKWKTVILFHLIEKKLRYNELRKEMPTVTERTLSLQLKSLEEDGLIKRKVYTTKPPLKVEYSLTEFGNTLIPVIQSIANWGIFVTKEKNSLIKN